jgi:DNA-binding transcriptional ArsR family regulator
MQPDGCLIWDDGPVDMVFRALADPTRRRLLDSLTERTGQSLRELCAGLEMARQTVSKHLAVLETANLVATERRGREKLHFVNGEPLRAIAERWLEQYSATPAPPSHPWANWHDAVNHP